MQCYTCRGAFQCWWCDLLAVDSSLSIIIHVSRAPVIVSIINHINYNNYSNDGDIVMQVVQPFWAEKRFSTIRTTCVSSQQVSPAGVYAAIWHIIFNTYFMHYYILRFIVNSSVEERAVLIPQLPERNKILDRTIVVISLNEYRIE